MPITDLQWEPGSNRVTWVCDGAPVLWARESPLQSVCLLDDGDGLAIAESIKETGPRNAVIVNCDGSERIRLAVPFPSGETYGYDSIYYVGHDLTGIVVTTLGEWAVIIDPATGQLSGLRESR